MIGYHISPGYNPNHRPEAVWPALKEVAIDLCEHPSRIIEEAQAFGLPASFTITGLHESAERYRSRSDATVTFIEPTTDRPGQVMQLASGGGESRELKEHMRRAFCRLVIAAMHRRGMEVSLTVA